MGPAVRARGKGSRGVWHQFAKRIYSGKLLTQEKIEKNHVFNISKDLGEASRELSGICLEKTAVAVLTGCDAPVREDRLFLGT